LAAGSTNGSGRKRKNEGFEERIFHQIDRLASEADNPYHEVRLRLDAILMDFETEERDPEPVLLKKLEAGPASTFWVTCQLLEAVEPEEMQLLSIFERLLPAIAPEDNPRIALLSLAFRTGLIHTLVERNLISLAELDRLHDHSRNEALAQLEEDPFAAVSLYEGARDLPIEVVTSMLEDLISSSRPAVVPLLALWAEHPDQAVAEKALEGLGRYPSPESRALLEGLETHRLLFDPQIERLIGHMERSGVAAHRPDLGTIHRCLISAADGRGTSMVHLSRLDADGTISYVHLVLNEERGITDCIGLNRESDEEYSVLDQNLVEDEMVTVPLELVRSRIEEALCIHRQGAVPCAPTFVLWRHLLGEPLEAGKHPIDLNLYGLSDVRAHVDQILPQSDTLLDASPFRDWWPDVQSTYNFVREHPELSQIEEDESPPEHLVERFLETGPEFDRACWSRRLARTVEYLSARNWGGDALMIRGALAVWVASSERMMPLTAIPFYRVLARTGLRNVGFNVSLGFLEPTDEDEEWGHEH